MNSKLHHEKIERQQINSIRVTDDSNPRVEASPVLFSLETLIITVSAGAVAALVVGFVTGRLRELQIIA